MERDSLELDLLRDFYGKWLHYHDRKSAPADVLKQAGDDLIEAHYAIQRFAEPVIIHG